ncbi:16S rRNA (cytosine(967)-C(5))-methyltransferase RsmB [Halothiobacillus sp. DCM-1]|uniref:16S rRNA (cytosine(967)-C(5))-methyltransferase RsmB n=1 Tax=Halothiobacillus sp. DCM-1 TaxID=3112558 RepID=UPI0032562AF1
MIDANTRNPSARGTRRGGGHDPDRPPRVDPRSLPRRSPEALTAQILLQVVSQGVSLDQALTRVLAQAQPVHRALVQAMSFETLRHFEWLVHWRDQLLERPIPAKSIQVALLLLVGLERLRGARRDPSKTVNSAVTAARELGHPWATGLINAVLRRAARECAEVETPARKAPDAVGACLPPWLFSRLQGDWGVEAAQAIGAAMASHPPMTLRIAGDRLSYAARLAAEGLPHRLTPFSRYGITLESPVEVDRLPGFTEGLVSVQDEAAQWVVDLMALAPGQRVLDACSAPGGKTLALLQQQSPLSLTALDIDPARLARVQENLDRARVFARLVVGDAAQPSSWWDGEPFDRILADVPCSATGVIRRHPDIKRLRRDEDMAPLIERQAEMLAVLWRLLKPGGRLVYATCSVLQAENAGQIAQFLAQHPDAVSVPIEADWGVAQGQDGRFLGRQAFPVTGGHDGFFYAVLEKRSASAD